MKKILLFVVIFMLVTSKTLAASWQIQQARQEYKAGAYSSALKTINAAINDSSSEDIECYKIRADIYLKLNSPVSAIKDLNIVLDNVSDPDLLKKRAWAYYKINEYEYAYKDFFSLATETKRNGGIHAGMTGFKAIVNNKKAPLDVRLQALCSIQKVSGMHAKSSGSINLSFKYLLICAICEGLISKIVYTETESLRLEQQSKIKEVIANKDFGNEFGEGIYEYCIGHKDLGRKLILGYFQEQKERETDPNLKCFDSYIINNFQSIINALETSQIEFDTNLF